MSAPGKKSLFSRIPRGTVFRITLLAFIAVGISYLNLIFTTSSRWAFLALLIVSLVPYGELFLAFRSRYSPFLLGYLLWCFATGLWSQVPLLSMLKASALAIVITAFVGAGRSWVARLQPDRAINFLLPVVGAAVFAGLFSRGHPVYFKHQLVIYQGLAGNPNYLGVLGAAGLPLPLYKTYVAWTENQARSRQVFWAALVFFMIAVLWWSASRASILCALVIVLAFGVVVTPGRRSLIVISALVVGAMVTVAAPEAEQGVYERVIIKSANSTDAFFSRRMTWERTYEGAKEGGVLGLGYGVSAGFADFSFGLTSNKYGREKGNTQLAIWEESGLIGLALYLLLIATMFQEFLSSFPPPSQHKERVEYALIVGLVAGLLAQSVFEAWWTSPGSMESSMFWAAVGVASALASRHSANQAAFSAAQSPPFTYRPAVRRASID